MRADLKGIHRVKRRLADGTVREHVYAWRGGPKMMSAPGTEDFLLEFARHKQAAAADGKMRTIEDLIDHFTGPVDPVTGRPHATTINPDFDRLAPKTQKDYLYAFRAIRAQWPRLPVRLIAARGMKKDIREWHRSFADNPRKADKLLTALSSMLSYAARDELIERNPCAGIRKLYRGSRRNAVWTADDIAFFRARAPEHMVWAFEFGLLTGQRQGDVLALKWSDYDGTYLRFRQRKTGQRVRLLVHADLRAVIDRLPRRAVTMLTNTRGCPWTSTGFQTSWRQVLSRIGIAGLTYHDLRGTFITARRREGATAEQIASISGHSLHEVNAVLERHYLADDQAAGDAVILGIKSSKSGTKL